MSLTIREKEHWKERIEKRIKAEIDEIKSFDREFFNLVESEAQRLATVEIGIELQFRKRRLLEDEMQRLVEEIEAIESAMVETIKKTVPGLDDHNRKNASLITAALSKVTPKMEKNLIVDLEPGQRILELEREKETLLNAVELTTSPLQIRKLWKQFEEVLNQKPSGLQNQLLQSAEE